MQKQIDWDEAAADTFTYLNQGKERRAFKFKDALALVDRMAVEESVAQSELVKSFSANFIATTLSNVTTAVHGGGSVPKMDGWYSTVKDPLFYNVNADFAAAWRKRRNL